MSGQKQQLFKCFKPNGSFSVVNLHIFEETCMLLESPFHASLNTINYDRIIVILITIGMRKKLMYCFSCYLVL